MALKTLHKEHTPKANEHGIVAEYLGLTEIPDTNCLWSSKAPIPAIGDRVHVNINGFGPGTVVAYFLAYAGDTKAGNPIYYLGVEVHCDEDPDWYTRHHGGHCHPLVFGAEINGDKPIDYIGLSA